MILRAELAGQLLACEQQCSGSAAFGPSITNLLIRAAVYWRSTHVMAVEPGELDRRTFKRDRACEIELCEMDSRSGMDCSQGLHSKLTFPAAVYLSECSDCLAVLGPKALT